MRLPERDDGKPDPEESVRIIHRAFELGVNYIDTAVMYCHHESETIVGQALKGWRDRVYVSTKNHYMGSDEKAWWKNLSNSLARLDVDCIDVYNVHGINWKNWERWVKGPNQILSWLHKAQDQGLIRHICCSFHDDAEALGKIADTDAFSSITLQYNLLDRTLETVFPKVAEKDIGLVVMGPVGGGRLGAGSEHLMGLLDGARTVPEVALRFVLSSTHVTAAISGMGSLAMVEENCAVAARPEPLSDAEHRRVHETLERFKGLADLYCTGCKYCLPCPHGVDIPGTFSVVNMERVYGLAEHARNQYKNLVGKATYCVACGDCEPKCPQEIPIRAQLHQAAETYDAAYGQMGFAIEPVGRDDEGIRFRARFHNLADASHTATVRLTVEDGRSVVPDQFEVTIDKPFHVQEETFTLAGAGVTDTFQVAADIDDGAGRRTSARRFRIGPCRRVDAIEAAPADEEGAFPIVIQHEDQVYAGKEHLGRPYGLEAWTAYTPGAFGFGARITARPGDDTAHVTLLIDLRSRHGDLPPGFHDGMVMVRVTPDIRVLRGDLEAEQIAVGTTACADGTEVRVQIAWEALGGYCPEIGQAFGLDVLLVIADGQGQERFRAGWSAHPSAERDACRLGTLFFTA